MKTMTTCGAVKLLILSLVFTFLPLGASGQDELRIGLIPEDNIFDQVRRHKPLAAYLSDKLGIKVKLTILSRYGDIVDKFESGRMDGAFFGILTGYIAMEKLGVEPVATPVTLDRKSTVQSYIFVRKDSGIKTVRDMRGKRMAFVDKYTVSGFMYAVAFLRENGVNNPETYFKDYTFTGSHDSVVYSVLDNRADIGCVKDRIYKKMVEKDRAIGNELNIIAVSQDFPSATLCVRKDMPRPMKSKLKKVLLAMSGEPEGKEVLGKLGALNFADVGKGDFRVIRELIRKAGPNVSLFSDKMGSEGR